MIIKLIHGGKIHIDMMERPERVDRVHIRYEYELGTNHLYPQLVINGHTHLGDNIFISLDEVTSRVDLIVRLLDINKRAVRTYVGNFTYDKYCTIGPKKNKYDLYEYVCALEEQIEKLKNEGEVI